MADTFTCTLITPERRVLEEQVAYASIPVWDGLLGVAPGRAPLLVKLGDGPLRLDDASGKSKYYFLGGGFAEMDGRTLTLLTSEATQASEIDGRAAEEHLKQVNKTVALTDEEQQQKDRDLTRARAHIRLAAKTR